MTALISVIMPVYNGEEFLHQAIDSILNQTITDFEFIIINDGSTDNSEQIILSYQDSRIVYVKNEANLKLIKTLNKGIALAKGKYIARMDADDISFANRFEEQLALFNSTNCDVIGSSYTKIDKNGNTIGNHLGLDAEGFDIAFVSLFVSPLVHPSVMIKTSVLKQYMYTDSSQCQNIEDYDLWCRMVKDGINIRSISKPLMFYRRTATNITEIHKEENTLKHVLFAQNMQSYYLQKSLEGKSINLLIPIEVEVSRKEVSKSIAEALILLQLFQTKYNKLNSNVKSWFYYRLFVAIIKSRIHFVKKTFVLMQYFFITHYVVLYIWRNYKYKNK